jgi:hypothetical protein
MHNASKLEGDAYDPLRLLLLGDRSCQLSGEAALRGGTDILPYSKTLEEALARCLVSLMAKGTEHPKGLDWGHE